GRAVFELAEAERAAQRAFMRCQELERLARLALAEGDEAKAKQYVLELSEATEDLERHLPGGGTAGKQQAGATATTPRQEVVTRDPRPPPGEWRRPPPTPPEARRPRATPPRQERSSEEMSGESG